MNSNGEISEGLGPNITKEKFLSHFGTKLYCNNSTKNIFRFKETIKINDASFWINVIFDDNRMKIVELSDANETFQNSYNDWSNYRNKKKREAHDRWLLQQLGRPVEKKTNALTFNRSWGSATSYTDMKNGEVKIMISYK
ncbi:hypothetical protein [Sporolactobacillus terrae]|uniref:Uncharacterized protein n=1 Tax=Sporolactobacillus terrae TaxID=269673 RepID=A0ABX5Q590_9BACL|nr:hypothetical protein [Sporolactobacillus terrae]QAA21801.1 hypothetical protein C0674_03720 [Sporolactobacillus terrae]QAA24774.1 hypothetical protein C0679_03695 [Sporolactobacillus terrae]UAK16600.1 hypothetical protein K7399_01070 [Sporolactobacillus terrae]